MIRDISQIQYQKKSYRSSSGSNSQPIGSKYCSNWCGTIVRTMDIIDITLSSLQIGKGVITSALIADETIVSAERSK
jgi:hypothetical protein